MSKKRNNADYARLFKMYRGKPLKILLHFFDGEGLSVFKALIFNTMKYSPVWVFPIVTANIINVVSYPNEHSFSEIWINLAIMSVFLLQNIYTTYAVAKVYDKIVRKIEYRLRSVLTEKLQSLSISFHKHNGTGKLLSKVMRDCENVETLLSSIARTMFDVLSGIIITITVILKKSPSIMLFFAVFIPIELFVVRKLRGKIRRQNTRFRTEIEETQSGVSEMLELIPVTRAHGLQKREIEKMESKFGTIMNVGYSLDKTTWLFNALSWVIMQFAQVSCLVFTSFLAFKGKIKIGDIVMYQTYFGQIVNNVNAILNLYPQIAKGMESVNSIGEILDDERIETDNKIIPLPNLMGKIEFRDICYKYPDGDDFILNNFNIKIEPGESLAFVGGSGAGKSTVLNLLIGFDRPQSGSVLIDGINLMNINLTQFRQQIAVVPQNTILFSGTIRDNITYGVDGVTDEALRKVIEDVGLEDVIDALPDGADTHLGEHGGTLSGGQRQRISIARALLRNPKIIIFDEATSALDSVSEKKVQMAVDKMMKHCTTILVAHRLSTIKNADRIAVVKSGQISEIGSYDELMERKGDFYSLKKLQE